MKYLLSFLFLLFINLKCVAQIVLNPVFDKTDVPAFRIAKVGITQDTTYIQCFYNAEQHSWANISRNTYLRDCITGKKYPLLKCNGLPYAPEKESFDFSMKVIVTLFFPPISTEMHKFDFIENENEEAFNIYGINLREVNDSSAYMFSVEYARSLSNMAEFYSIAGNIRKSIELEEQSMSIKRALLGCKNIEYAGTVFNLSRYYSKDRNFKKAIILGEEDLELCSLFLGKDNETYGNSLLFLESYYNSAGNYKQAEQYGRKAVNLFYNLYGEEHPQYAFAVSSLSQDLYAQSHLSEAIELEMKALQIREKLFGKSSNEYAMSLHNLSLDYAAMGDIPKAINYSEMGISIKKKNLGIYDESYISSLNNLASFYSLKDGYIKACELEKEVVRLSEVVYGYNHPEYAKALENLGGYYLRLGKNKEGEKYISMSNDIMRQLSKDNNNYYAISLNNLAMRFSLKKDYAKAIEYGEKALNVLDSSHSGHSLLLSNMASYYAGTGNYALAIDYLKQAMDEIKKGMLEEFVKMDFESKYLYWQNTHSVFDDVYPMYVAHSKDTLYISDLYDSVLFSEGVVWRNDLTEIPSWKKIQSKLDDGDIAIEFISPVNLTTDTIMYYALTIKKGQEHPKMIKLFNSWQFEDSLRCATSNYDKKLKVGNLVWKPLKEELRDVKNIFFSPSNILTSIPIEYMPVNKHENYSDLYSIYRLSSTGELVNKNYSIPYTNAILYGGLDFEGHLSEDNPNGERGGFEQLYYSKDEVCEIDSILKNNRISCITLIGNDGTEQSFKQLSRKKNSIIHISTHGASVKQEDIEIKRNKDNFTFLPEFSSDASFYQSASLSCSFIVMAGGNQLIKRIPNENTDDGILTALEISKMDLSQVDLIVLATCESASGAVGADDSILGLQKGFKKAGAKTILMSLKKIDDEATRILMVEFYRNLMKGKTKRQSLQDAQIYLRKVENGKYDNPKYWESFILLDGLN